MLHHLRQRPSSKTILKIKRPTKTDCQVGPNVLVYFSVKAMNSLSVRTMTTSKTRGQYEANRMQHPLVTATLDLLRNLERKAETIEAFLGTFECSHVHLCAGRVMSASSATLNVGFRLKNLELL